ncbi:MAG: YopX family protein [Candidatus Pacebacteria bacterium]|nr:YopX family protein [Candidatus Paceibacterota bacterium]
MERKIKFRAWDKENKEWSEYFLGVDKDGKPLFDGGDDLYPDVVVNCSTGLKDRNGKEIYEGDIVKNNDIIWELYWSDGCYKMAKNGVKTDNDHLFIDEAQHSEVIGNIYENGDLLNS